MDNRFHKNPLWVLNKEKLTAREMDEVFNGSGTDIKDYDEE